MKLFAVSGMNVQTLHLSADPHQLVRTVLTS